MSETDVPEGYRPAVTYEDAAMAFVCLACGAVVARSEATLHSQWHADIRELQRVVSLSTRAYYQP